MILLFSLGERIVTDKEKGKAKELGSTKLIKVTDCERWPKFNVHSFPTSGKPILDVSLAVGN